MSEEVMINRAYQQIGVCKECGAAVCVSDEGSDARLVSACSCAGGWSISDSEEAARLIRVCLARPGAGVSARAA